MFSLPDAARHLKTSLTLPASDVHVKGFSIDSRSLKAGELFFALAGKQDGHDFLEPVFRQGASGAVIKTSYLQSHSLETLEKQGLRNLLAVEDPRRALGSLAEWHRSCFTMPLIGITGSVGKSTTKEMLHFLLASQRHGIANQGNLNNDLGVPLTLLRLKDSDEFCVCEMGANHRGEIAALAEMAKPSGAIITGIAPAHLEGFGSLDNVYSAKLELFGQIKESGWGIVPDDDLKLIERARGTGIRLLTAGWSPKADFQLSDLELRDGRIFFAVNGVSFSFPGIASFYVRNAVLAIAAAVQCGLSMGDLPRDWVSLPQLPGRFNLFPHRSGARLIDDTYNASPLAFTRAIEALENVKVTGRKMILFSDMLELGEESERYHRELGRQLAKANFDWIGAYGPYAALALDELNSRKGAGDAMLFEEAAEAALFLDGFLKANDLLYLKGSRGMRVDQVVQRLKSASMQGSMPV